MVAMNGFELTLTRIPSPDNFYATTGFTLTASNTRDTLCDVEIQVDAHYVGTFRIPPHDVISFDQNASIWRHVHFIDINNNFKTGQITAVFKPERCHVNTVGSWRHRGRLSYAEVDHASITTLNVVMEVERYEVQK